MMSAMLKLRARRAALTNDDKGFSLIELLVVVLILGILAAIAIPVFIGQQNQALDAAAEANLANAKVAAISHLISNASLPTGSGEPAATLANSGWPQGEPGVTVGTPGTGERFCFEAVGGNSVTFHITDIASAETGTCA